MFLKNVTLQGYVGTLHFIRFPSDQMDIFTNMVIEKQFALLVDTFHATGGGAYKFDSLFQSEINIKFNKLDELECLIKGIFLILTTIWAYALTFLVTTHYCYLDGCMLKTCG